MCKKELLQGFGVINIIIILFQLIIPKLTKSEEKNLDL